MVSTYFAIVAMLFTHIGVAYVDNDDAIIYVSKHGDDFPDCGFNITMPCGTMYYGSTLLSLRDNITTLYVIDGQNEVFIQLYIDNITTTNNNTNTTNNHTIDYYHPCLPKKNLYTKFSHCEELESEDGHYDCNSNPIIAEITIIFNDIYITSMNDWYPSICDNQNLLDSIIYNDAVDWETQFQDLAVRKKNYVTFFDQFSDTIETILAANFINLRIDNYHFSRLTIFNTNNINNLGKSRFTCYNCVFINISFTCSHDTNTSTHLIDANEIVLINTEVSNIIISCNNSVSSSLFYSLFSKSDELYDKNAITFENVQLSNIHVEHTLFIVGEQRIFINDCIFYNIITGYDIFGENKTSSNSNITITNTNFSYINNAIYLSNKTKSLTDKLWILNVYFVNVNFVIDNTEETALFEFDSSTAVTFNNINIYYEYNVSQNCKHPRFLLPLHGYVNVICNNPQSFIVSYGTVKLENIFINSNINDHDHLYRYHQFINTQSAFDVNISYSYEALAGDYGLINNWGESSQQMEIINMTISPYSLHHDIFVSTKSIILNNVIIAYDNTSKYIPFNYSLLESEFFLRFINLAVSGVPKQITIINCYLTGLRDVIIFNQNSDKAPIDKIEIFNSSLLNSVIAVQVWHAYEFVIKDCYFAALHTVLWVSYINQLMIQSSYFAGYGRASMIYNHRCEYVEMNNNTFKLSDQLNLISLIETEYFLNRYTIAGSDQNQFILRAEFVSNMQFVSNFFGLGIKQDIPALYLLDTNNSCFSNNIFHNYAIHIDNSNITSCYKSQMLTHCHYSINNSKSECCSSFGPIRHDLVDKLGYFILNNSNIEPITSANMVLDFQQLQISDKWMGIALENMVFKVMDNRTKIVLPMAQQLLFTDVILDTKNPVDFGYPEQYCHLICNNQMNEQLNVRTQINMQCTESIPWNVNREDVVIKFSLEWQGSQTLTYGTPHSLILTTNNNGSYFPGQLLSFNFTVLDQFNNKIINYNNKVEISVSIMIKNNIFSYLLSIDETGNCLFCDAGIYISPITFIDSNVGDTFSLLTQDKNNALIIPDVDITIINCPKGYGVDVFDAHCALCPEGFYQLFDDYQNYCKNGNQGEHDGFKCEGGDIIIIETHNWVAIQGITNIDIFDENSIISSLCPYGMCCSVSNGCNYVLNTKSLCANNRDPLIPLCGACLDSFSESMNSAHCVKCSDRSIYYEWLLVPLSLAIIFTIYLVITKSQKVVHSTVKNTKNKTKSHYVTWKQIIKHKRIERMAVIMVSKVLIYYEQSLSQIILSGSIIINVSTFSALFDLSVMSSNSNTGLCFISGLTAKGKILCNLIAPLFVCILVICTSYILNKFSTSRHILLSKALLALLLLCIGQILSVIFKYLSCQQIGDNTNFYVHFYFGNTSCYGSTWFIALVGLILIISFFIYLFIKLKRMKITDRQNSNHPLYVLIRSYKPNYYFWECIILSRRIIVVFIAVSFKSNFATLWLIIILGIFLLLQINCEPFIMREINKMEQILLFCLILAVSAQLALTSQSDYVVAFFLLMFLIIIPFILFFYYIGITAHKIKTAKFNNVSVFNNRVKYLSFSLLWWLSYQNRQNRQNSLSQMDDSIDNNINNNNESANEWIELEEVLDDLEEFDNNEQNDNNNNNVNRNGVSVTHQNGDKDFTNL